MDFYDNIQLEELFIDLPIRLRGELIKYSYGSTLSKIRVFQDRSPDFFWKLGSKMRKIKVENGLQIYEQEDYPGEGNFIYMKIII